MPQSNLPSNLDFKHRKNYLATTFHWQPKSIQILKPFEDYYYQIVEKLWEQIGGSQISPSDWNTKVLPVVDLLLAHARSNSESVTGYSPPCEAGCWYCCKNMAINIANVELTGIVQGIEQSDVKEQLKHQIRHSVSTKDGLGCSMLLNGECKIYSSRPLTCRLYFGLIKETCVSYSKNGQHRPVISPLPMLILNAFKDYFPETLSGSFDINAVLKRVYESNDDSEQNILNMAMGGLHEKDRDIFRA